MAKELYELVPLDSYHILQEKLDNLEKPKKEGYANTFNEVFDHLLRKKDIEVTFSPYIINKMLSTDRNLLSLCLIFDYYMSKIPEDMMGDLMFYLLPLYNGKYFKFPKESKADFGERDDIDFLSTREKKVYAELLSI